MVDVTAASEMCGVVTHGTAHRKRCAHISALVWPQKSGSQSSVSRQSVVEPAIERPEIIALRVSETTPGGRVHRRTGPKRKEKAPASRVPLSESYLSASWWDDLPSSPLYPRPVELNSL